MVSQPKKPAAAIINNRLMVCLMESQKTPGRLLSVKSLYNPHSGRIFFKKVKIPLFRGLSKKAQIL
jgi:hypothetical protein